MIFSVKAPGLVDTPISAVDGCLEVGRDGARVGVGNFVRCEPAAIAGYQSAPIYQPAVVLRFLRGQPLLGERKSDQIGDPGGGRSRAEEQNPLFRQGAPHHSAGGQEAR